MSPRPVIFISAVSRELRSARQLIANSLHFLGYDAEWQDIFGAEEGDLRAMLRRRIDASAGVVQIIGQCYGAEPTVPDEEFGRVSYTQYETLYAKKRGKKVWLLILEETFPTDPHEQESEEFATLQQTYRQRIRSEAHLFQPIDDPKSLEIHIHKLRDDLSSLRRRTKAWLVGVLAALLLIGAGTIWLIFNHHRSEVKIDLVLEKHGKLEQALVQLAEVEMRGKQSGEQLTPVELRSRAYTLLEKDLALPAGTLAKELPGFALQIYSRPDATLQQRAQAAYALGKHDEAETLSAQSAAQEAQAYEQASRLAEERRQKAFDGYLLAGRSAQSRIEFDRALTHLRAAAPLFDRERDILEWADLQSAIASVLLDAGRPREAEPLIREAISLRGRLLGPAHPHILRSRNALGLALDAQGKYQEALDEHRAVLEIRKKLLGSSHEDTLSSWHNLANVFLSSGKYAEAENAYRSMLPHWERLVGSEHPNVLACRGNLAHSLHGQRKFKESEEEIRSILVIRTRTLGPDHLDTIHARNNLALTLTALGRAEEGEKESRAVLEVWQRVYGSEHPNTIAARNNIANALSAQGKHSEAEIEHLAVLDLRERILGPDHPHTIQSRRNLLAVFNAQGKYADTEKQQRAILAFRQRTMSPDHPAIFENYYWIARALYDQKKLPEAFDLARQAETGMLKALGPDHEASKTTRVFREKIEAELTTLK